jgi:hypothetical protein
MPTNEKLTGIMKALIIREPWIEQILAGRKTWEMRSSRTHTRGRIGLIRQGTGMVVGVADLVDSRPRLNAAKLSASRRWHAIPKEEAAAACKKGRLYPWVLRNARRLERPVRAGQKPGQVIWVSLSPKVAAAIERQCSERAPAHS